eukprot:CAMPEP_0115503646 /NCGR_PEP_ID=MMETSP0271-20121206/69588_1 /TAXON_ID=71861 /ORGANISM="Scrippsiella trochoidea, Strain CCMP3099" /LENGTH=487 /DNA_ID=CAMNT_0002932753 /DNA_START=13 /DNA_END=1473 /DNA_ORIENTATION=+
MTTSGADDGPPVSEQNSHHARLESMRKTEQEALRAHWTPHRLMMSGIIDSRFYQVALGIMIAIHAVLIVIETDSRASDMEVQGWQTAVGYIFMVVYIVDLTIRLYVHRWLFFLDAWNVIDFIIVTMDLASEALTVLVGEVPSLAVMRVCRLSRLLRFKRFLRLFRELDIMLMGFLSAMKAMAWATIMIAVFLTLFSVVAVEILHPVANRLTAKDGWQDCERCPRAFSSVMAANLTFLQQVVAGDGWGELSVPIIEEEPIAAIFLIGVFVIVQFGMVNLIVTVIVDVANTAREADELRKIEDRAREFSKIQKQLLKLCEELDTDHSGDLSLEELLFAMDHNARFAQLMATLDIGKDDMHVVFRVLDEDHSGSVMYKEFVDQLHKVKSQDTQTTLIFIKGHLNEVRSKVSEQLSILRDQVLSSNVDLTDLVRKLIFGDHVVSNPKSISAPPKAVGAKGALASALRANEGSSADMAVASGGKLDECANGE